MNRSIRMVEVDQTGEMGFCAIPTCRGSMCGRRVYGGANAVVLGAWGMVGVRKLLSLVVLVALVTAGLGTWTPAAQAADTGNAAQHPGKIVSDEPGSNAPNILDGTVYSIAKVGNTMVVGGEFSQVRNFNTSTTFTRRNVLAFDATTGRVRTSFAPDPFGTVYKVLPTGDGRSAYVAGSFEAAAGRAMSSRLFKIDVTSGVVDSTFAPPAISGEIRDLQVVGNRLYIAGKFTHINGIPQKALGSLNATTGARDPYVATVVDGQHRPEMEGTVTNVLQISVNKQNTRLMAVGNFTSVDAQSRSQIVQLDITGAAPTVTSWNTNLFTSACASQFESYVSDVEYSPNGEFFIVSTTGAYGGASGSMAGTVGCDVVARFESSSTTLSPATWTSYTGGDTTWTVEVTNNVVYAGGHQRWWNNPQPANGGVPGMGAVSREGIAALSTVNGLPYSWNPTRERGVGVQDMLATNDGLYVGSDTDLIGHTTGNMFHARIAVLPLAGGSNLPQQQATALPANVYRVASGGSTLSRRSFTGTTVGTATTAPSGPGWSTSTGAFMVNGVLYKTNTDGSLSRMTFDGTNYGTASAVSTATRFSPRPTGTTTPRRSPASSTATATSTTPSQASTRSTAAVSRSRAASSVSSGSAPPHRVSTGPTPAAPSSSATSCTSATAAAASTPPPGPRAPTT